MLTIPRKATNATRKGKAESVSAKTIKKNLTLDADASQTLRSLGIPGVTSEDGGADTSDYGEYDDPASRKIRQTSQYDSENSIKQKRKRRRNKKKGNSKIVKCTACSSDSDSEPHDAVKWPHEFLGARYNNYGKSDTKYKQLDMRMLVAGEINIICNGGVSESERNARLKLLGDVVYSSAYYQWGAILKLHAAILSEVAAGHMNWGDDYARLEQQMLMPFPISKPKEKKSEKSGTQKQRDSRANAEERVVYCSDYQQRNCQHADNHQGQFFGQSVTLQHICANCWKVAKVKANHPGASTDCPNHEH